MGFTRGKAIGLTILAAIVIIVLISSVVLLTMERNASDGEEIKISSQQEIICEPNKTLLKDYLTSFDDAYTFSILDELTQSDDIEMFTSYVINMTSQEWLTANDTDRSLWWHHVIIIVPDVIHYKDTGLIFVSSGDNTDSFPNPSRDAESRIVSHIATQVGVVSAVIRQVPNQPITFQKDIERQRRRGSGLLAYTLRQVIEGQARDCNWLLLCPMMKSIVRGMDTLTNFTNGSVTRFYLSGAAERAWATWLTAAVDDRVVGILPLVFGNLNFVKSLKHHRRTLNGYSWGMKEFLDQNLTNYLTDPEAKHVFNILDPLSYKHLLNLPKYIILSSNDEQYVPDSTRLFFELLNGPTFLRIYPNTDNSLVGSWHRVASDCIGFILTLEEKWMLPDVRWNITENNNTASIYVRSDKKPLSVMMWSAITQSSTRRDFRSKAALPGNATYTVDQPIMFKDSSPEIGGPNEFRSTVSQPEQGWLGTFMEMVFEAPRGARFTLTTELTVVPDTYPTDECEDEECTGSLV